MASKRRLVTHRRCAQRVAIAAAIAALPTIQRSGWMKGRGLDGRNAKCLEPVSRAREG